MKKAKLISEIKKLKIPSKEFMVFGSGILCIKGFREVDDIDMLVSKKVFQKFKKDKTWVYSQVMVMGRKRNKLTKGDVEMFDNLCISENSAMNNMNYFIKNNLIENISGINFTSLTYMLFVKEFWAREKDLKDAEIIKKYLLK